MKTQNLLEHSDHAHARRYLQKQKSLIRKSLMKEMDL